MGAYSEVELHASAGQIENICEVLRELCLQEDVMENPNETVTVDLGEVSSHSIESLLKNLELERISCTVYCSNCSDTSVDDYSVVISEVDGEMVSDSMTTTGKLIVNTLNECLEFIDQGADLEELKQFINQKIKSTA